MSQAYAIKGSAKLDESTLSQADEVYTFGTGKLRDKRVQLVQTETTQGSKSHVLERLAFEQAITGSIDGFSTDTLQGEDDTTEIFVVSSHISAGATGIMP
ncbi:hypothetical protein FRC03_000887 [Tulasnella sp. 419]|nr:hypothetical protein FRC03_000887 [Tulasnella sp. 419]